MYEEYKDLNKDLLSAEVKWGNRPIPRVILEPADLVLAADCGRLVYNWWLSRRDEFKLRQSWGNSESTHISGKICEISVAKWLSEVGVITDFLGWCTKMYNTLVEDPGVAFTESADILVKLPCFNRVVSIDVKSWRRRWWNHWSAPGVLAVDQIRRHTGKIDLYIATRPHTETDLTYIKRASQIGAIPIDIMFWTSLYHINHQMQPWCDPRKAGEYGKIAPHCITPSSIWHPMDMLLRPLNKPLDLYRWVNDEVIDQCTKGWEEINGRKWTGFGFDEVLSSGTSGKPNNGRRGGTVQDNVGLSA